MPITLSPEAAAGTSEDFIIGVRLALAEGAHLSARRLAEEGAARYPETDLLRQFAAVLAPPQVARSGPGAPLSYAESSRWLREHAAEYPGQWVALRGGMLLASASTLKDLRAQVAEMQGVFFTRVAA